MPRPKGSKNKAKTKPKKKIKDSKKTVKKDNAMLNDPLVEKVYEEWVEFTCPIRGKVRQKVKVKKYKRLSSQNELLAATSKADSAIEAGEAKDDGLSIYGEPEEGNE